MKPFRHDDQTNNSVGFFWLLTIWLFQCLMVSMLVYINPNHYTTVDSGFYLESARHLLEGNGYTVVEGNRLIWNGVFPPLYSVAIAAFSFTTNISVLAASKIVNLICSGVWLLFLFKKYGSNKAILLFSILLMGSFLKLWAHTWSEPMFLILTFIWVQKAAEFDAHSIKNHSISLLILGILVLATRYAGAFIILASSTLSVFYLRKGERKAALAFATMALLYTCTFLGYLYVNYSFSGSPYGGERLNWDQNFLFVLQSFGYGIMNEILLIRDFVSIQDLLFIFGLALQVLLILFIYRQYCQNQDFFAQNWSRSSKTFLLMAVLYLLFLLALRCISPFDFPGYRLLSPFTFLCFGGILLLLQPIFLPKVCFAWLLLILFSWLDIFPYHHLDRKIKHFIELI